MKNNKKAKFFCENCGSEVPEDARVCKKCGKFFISVRCPQCGTTGSHKDFEKGCPVCGYAVSKNNVKSDEKFSINRYVEKNYGRNARSVDSRLPAWIYILTASIMCVLTFAVYSCIRP